MSLCCLRGRWSVPALLTLTLVVLGPHPVHAQTLAISNDQDRRIIQRQFDGTASLELSGTFTGDVGGVEARVLRASDGTTVLDWTEIDGTPSGGAWSGLLASIPQGGWYRAEVRSTTNSTATTMGSRFGVGLVIAALGQSNMARMFTEDEGDGSLAAPFETPHDLTSRLGYGEPPGFEYERPRDADLLVTWGHVTGSGGIRLANNLRAATGLPILILDLALDWTGIDEHWNEVGGPFVGWQRFEEAVLESGGLEAVLWSQGAYDAVNRPTITSGQYKAALDRLYLRISQVAGTPNLPFGVVTLGRGDYNTSGSLDAPFQAVRRAQMEWIEENPAAFAAGMSLDLAISTRTGTGNGHFWAAGYQALGTRFAEGLLQALGQASEGAMGPQIEGATLEGRVVQVTITQEGGTRLVLPIPSRDLEGFELTEADWETGRLPIERAVLSSSAAGNQVLLLLGREPVGSVRLRYLYGQNPQGSEGQAQERRDPGNWLYDDVQTHPIHPGRPLEPTTDDIAVTTADLGPLPPAVLADVVYLAPGGEVTLRVLANDLGLSSALDPTSLLIEQSPAGTIVDLDTTSGTVTYRHGGVGDDGFTYSIADLDCRRASGRAEIRLLNQLPPVDGRVLHFEADLGLRRHESRVIAAWEDLSGSANHLNPIGDPRRVPQALNGQPCLEFDGSGDSLGRAEDLFALPGGASDRTVFTVVRYQGTGFGGVTWGNTTGDGTCGTHGNRAFGLVVDPSGRLMTQAWCDDLPTSAAGTGQGWLVHSATLEEGLLRQFKDGGLIASQSHAFNTASDGLLTLGAELDNAPFVRMDVAAVLVFDRALSEVERWSVEAYLQQKYFAASSQPPVAEDDDAFALPGTSTEVRILDNDQDADGLLFPDTVQVVNPPTLGTVVQVDPQTGAVTYQPTDGVEGVDQFTYTVEDQSGLVSNEATVTIQISATPNIGPLPALGLVLHLESDRGLVLDQDRVLSWQDQSPRANHLQAFGDPRLVEDEAHPHLRLDGRGDKLESLVPTGLPSGSADRTLFTVVRYRGTGYGGVAWGHPACNQVFGTVVDSRGNLLVQGWCGGNDFPTTENGTGAGWLRQTAQVRGQELRHFRDGHLLTSAVHEFDTASGILRIGVELDDRPYVDMDVAAVIVYDRALSEAERRQVESYLARKYTVAPNGLPSGELLLLLESDEGLEVSGDSVVRWQDQSGQENHLEAVGTPSLDALTPSQRPALSFDGVGDRLERLADLGALPEGSSDRTVFLVANYLGTGFGGFAWGQTGCNQVFGTVVDNRGDLTVQGWCRGNDFQSARTGTGSGWLVQNAILSNNELRHYLGGQQIDTQTHLFETLPERIVLGAEIDGRPSVAMEVAAVLVYGRALSEEERLAVEAYLQTKYMDPPPIPEPVALNDYASVQQGGEILLSILTNDRANGVLDPSSVTLLEGPTEGVIESIDPVTGSLHYRHLGGQAPRDRLTYTVSDDAGRLSNIATVEISPLPFVDGLVLHLDAGSGLLTDDDGRARHWLDLSPSMNDLVALGNPREVSGVLSAESVVRFDGIQDRFENLSELWALPSGSEDRTVFLVVDYRSLGFGGLTWGITTSAQGCA